MKNFLYPLALACLFAFFYWIAGNDFPTTRGADAFFFYATEFVILAGGWFLFSAYEDSNSPHDHD